jgi:hypothetical protein
MVFFSVTLDFVQGHRAGKAAASLRQSVSLRARVIRDGQRLEVAVADVVPGDLVMLSAGDMIPADALVLESNDFFVKQALLTGEPYLRMDRRLTRNELPQGESLLSPCVGLLLDQRAGGTTTIVLPLLVPPEPVLPFAPVAPVLPVLPWFPVAPVSAIHTQHLLLDRHVVLDDSHAADAARHLDRLGCVSLGRHRAAQSNRTVEGLDADSARV